MKEGLSEGEFPIFMTSVWDWVADSMNGQNPLEHLLFLAWRTKGSGATAAAGKWRENPRNDSQGRGASKAFCA